MESIKKETCSSSCTYKTKMLKEKLEKLTMSKVNLLEEIVRLKAEIELIKKKNETQV